MAPTSPCDGRAWGYPEAWLQEWEPELRISEDYIRRNAVFVAESEGRAVGVVGVGKGPDGSEISHLWISPDCQGQGLGRRLVECARTGAREARWPSLLVVSDPHARPFYEHLGAVHVGEVSAPVGAPSFSFPVSRSPTGWGVSRSTSTACYGVAADDAHDFGPESRDPGSSWVMVHARELSRPAILDALRRGDFHATTGVLLSDVQAGENRLCLQIDGYDSYGFRTDFIGPGGEVLRSDESAAPCFDATSRRGYVRARVQRSDGALAWVQPVFPSGG